MTNQIEIYAPIKGPEGYSFFARDLICELIDHGVHVCLEEFTNWGPWFAQLTPRQHECLSKALDNKPYPSNQPHTFLNICLPEQSKLKGECRNMIYTMFEADAICDLWHQKLQYFDKVLVPTDFNYTAFTKEVPKDLVHTLPLGYDSSRYSSEVEPLPLRTGAGYKPLMDYKYRFLVVCEITNRKNFWGTLQTWLTLADQFQDEICLILKVGNYSFTMPIQQKIQEFIFSLCQDGYIKHTQYPIFLYEPILAEEAHPHFLKCGTHYLSTSLGEGWDLTAMQSAACGLHLFIPANSAYECWLDKSTVTFLPISKQFPAVQDGALQRLYAGSNWSAYNMPNSIDMILSALKDPTDLEYRRRLLCQEVTKYSWEYILPQYLNALEID